MEVQQIVKQTQTKLSATVNRFKDELSKVRTGRANSAMLDGVMVDA